MSDSTKILRNDLIHFTVRGKKLSLRQPTTTEYDDSLTIENTAAALYKKSEEAKLLAEEPCSEAERQKIQYVINMHQVQLDFEPDEVIKMLLEERIKGLKLLQETRTMADEIGYRRAGLARDRWLSLHLLCDENGKQMFDVTKPEDVKKWEKMPISIKDEIRLHLGEVLRLIQDAPFDWDNIQNSK